MKRLKETLRLALLLAVGILLGLRVYTWNAQKLNGNAVPMPFGVGASVVLSGSMEPSLSVGDLLVFVEADTYSVGDVVVYQSGTVPVVHRIVALEEQTVTTRGDANNTADEPFALEQVKGKVAAVIPLAGYLILALQTPVGTLLTIGGAVLLTELSYRSERKENYSRQEEIKTQIRLLKQELEQQEP